jgi:hypothetical protein
LQLRHSTKEISIKEEMRRKEVVGAERFELPTLWSQTRCASQTALRPEIKEKKELEKKLSKKQTEFIALLHEGGAVKS